MLKQACQVPVFIGKLKEKRPLGRPRRKWEDNVKMDHREMGLEGVDRIHLARDRDR
jgi:hypothetical protein